MWSVHIDTESVWRIMHSKGAARILCGFAMHDIEISLHPRVHLTTMTYLLTFPFHTSLYYGAVLHQ